MILSGAGVFKELYMSVTNSSPVSLNMDEEVPGILIQCPTPAECGGIENDKKSEIIPMNNEEAFAYAFLDLHNDFYISDLKSESVKVPLGLELFSTMTRLKVKKREIVPDDDLSYRAFCQYDISDENQAMHIAIGLEHTGPWTVRCFQDSRLFNVHIYDYVCERILSVHRRFTWPLCLLQYSCIGWVFGLNGCGNYVEVFDSRDRLLGHIKQCPFYTKRLVYQSEPLKNKKKSWIIPCHAKEKKLGSFLRNIRQIWRDRKVKKFDVVNHVNGERKIRIEQYIRDGNTFKFILMDQMFNVGYVRKCSENEYTLIIWKYFDETDKALLLASSFLFDHIKFHVSLEGTYMKVHEMKYKEQFKTSSSTTCIPPSCQYNRCRLALYFLSLSVLTALPIILFIFL